MIDLSEYTLTNQHIKATYWHDAKFIEDEMIDLKELKSWCKETNILDLDNEGSKRMSFDDFLNYVLDGKIVSDFLEERHKKKA